jgi:stage II sporulation protein AA (anti-sigma F factor antagonist)
VPFFVGQNNTVEDTMKIFSGYDNGRLTLYLSGELDHHGAKGTMESIVGLIDEYMPKDCIVDLSKLSFMDSSGIAVILRAQKHMNEIGGKAWVEGPRGQPLRVLDASGVDRVISIEGITRQGEQYI